MVQLRFWTNQQKWGATLYDDDDDDDDDDNDPWGLQVDYEYYMIVIFWYICLNIQVYVHI